MSSDLDHKLNDIVAKSTRVAIARAKKEIKILLNKNQCDYVQRLTGLCATLGVVHFLSGPTKDSAERFGHNFRVTGPFGVDNSVLQIDWKAVCAEFTTSTSSVTATRKRKICSKASTPDSKRRA